MATRFETTTRRRPASAATPNRTSPVFVACAIGRAEAGDRRVIGTDRQGKGFYSTRQRALPFRRRRVLEVGGAKPLRDRGEPSPKGRDRRDRVARRACRIAQLRVCDANGDAAQ